MKVLIVDDEMMARKRLRALLAEVAPDGVIVGEAGDGGEALRLIAATAPDVVLMDVRMPRLDGLNAAREIARLAQPPAVIFVTAYEEYAVDAFDICAVDYLLKPIRKQRLEAALQKAKRFTDLVWRKLDAALPPGSRPRRGHLCLYSHGELRLVPLASVVYFRADSKYTVVRTETDEALLEESLVALEQEFGEGFMRIHRNALVATERIAGLAKLPDGGMGLRLHGVPGPLEVSRRHLPAVRAWLKRRAGELEQGG
ncbi:LytR/AlgR family response regulator transcription factor [Methylomagnum sp.]